MTRLRTVTGRQGLYPGISGVNLLPFMYLGAKHMMTGYDHILFLFGVIFSLPPAASRAVCEPVRIGSSTTMILGVYFNVRIERLP
jgi:hypothetical protein